MGLPPPSVEDAIALAARSHRGQRYPSPEAEPYIFHPLRVMLAVSDPLVQMAAVLHDVVEETAVGLADLEARGYPPAVVNALDCLTRRPDEGYGDYIDRVAGNDIARRVKVADLKENLANNRRTPSGPGAARRIERYEAALHQLGEDPVAAAR